MQQEDLQIVGMENIFRAGFKEFMRLRQQSSVEEKQIMEGAQRAMRVAYSREEEKLGKTSVISGYCRLCFAVYRPVWYGNWHYEFFLGLATQAQATLQVVAPGIAEALFATALVCLRRYLRWSLTTAICLH